MNEIQVQSQPEAIVFHPHPKSKRFLDLTGHSYGSLSVIGYASPVVSKSGNEVRYWWCKCKCGLMKRIDVSSLRSGKYKSCGCLRADACSMANLVHGMSRCPEHRSWTSMMQRCHDKKFKNYHRYGGRGISVFSGWKGRNGFLSFFAYMGKRPKGTTLGRINNDGNYEPGNCRWETPFEQAGNTSANRFVALDGVTLIMKEWSRRLNIPLSTIYSRLSRGWSVTRSLSTERYVN